MNTIFCIMQVAFIGISNWALDPAKMNRGILVQRDVPDEEELIETARLADDALSVFRKYEFRFFKVKIETYDRIRFCSTINVIHK